MCFRVCTFEQKSVILNVPYLACLCFEKCKNYNLYLPERIVCRENPEYPLCRMSFGAFCFLGKDFETHSLVIHGFHVMVLL